jgi:hypothetical protein
MSGHETHCRAVRPEAVAGYEELRRHVLENETGDRGELGLVLFIREGMMSWARAWSDSMKESQRKPMDRVDSPKVPAALYGEVVMILAQMVLGTSRMEVTP